MANIHPRSDCYQNRYGQTECYNSAWDNWVRWLVLALIIVAAFLIFFLFSCITARRRRRMGYAPYRGTGWAVGRTAAGHSQPTYNAQPYYANQQQQQQQPYYNNSNNPPPAYNAAVAGGANADYYGRGNDVELQQPEQAYGGYAPPKGPPPGHS